MSEKVRLNPNLVDNELLFLLSIRFIVETHCSYKLEHFIIDELDHVHIGESKNESRTYA